MKLTKRISSQPLIILALLFLLMPQLAFAKNNSPQCLYANNQTLLKNYAGKYVLPDIIKNLRKSRKLFSSIYLAVPKNSNYNIAQIEINNDGKVLFIIGDSYHETYSWNEINPSETIKQQCLEIVNDNLTFRWEENGKKLSRKYVKIHQDSFFNILFQGCYQSDSKEKWCFENNKITVNKKIYEAELLLDSSQLPGNIDNFLKIKEEDSLWAFIPIKNGWKIYTTNFASEDDIDIKFDRPWKTLTNPENKTK